MKDEYTTFDIIKKLNIPRERLRQWMVRGYIEPSIRKADGVRIKALFSREDVYKIALFKKLIELGFNRQRASRFIKSFWSDQVHSPVGKEPYILIRVGALFKRKQLPKDLEEWDVSDAVKDGIKYRLGHSETELVGMMSDKNTIDLEVGEFVDPSAKHPGDSRTFLFPKEDMADWDSLIVINFDKIKKDVDAVLAA